MTLAPPSWQTALSRVITDPLELAELLNLDPTSLSVFSSGFPLRVPREFVARMQKGNLADPLLLQILPTLAEKDLTPGYTHDPLEEQAANLLPGLLHKYHGRVLWLVGKECAVHCRYCFRQHFPYSENLPGKAGWEAICEYIAADPTIEEVIFSGGDPLVNKDRNLEALTNRIAQIPHVKYLRVHTRLPIVIPQRITEECLNWMTSTRLQPIVVIHCNHPQEVDKAVLNALKMLKSRGVTVLNQAVLLRDINDNADILVSLSKQLFQAGVLPYYLHWPDKVLGTAHFDVALEKAQALIREVACKLPGYLVPKLVQERAGFPFKYPLTSTFNFE